MEVNKKKKAIQESEEKQLDIPGLHRLLYNAAKYCIHPDYRDKSEAVKVKRDETCNQLYGQPYEMLDAQQLFTVINHLQQQSGFQKTKSRQPKKNYASAAMVKRLRFSAMYVALHYCPLDGLSIELDGRILAESDLRDYLKTAFAKKTKDAIPSNIFNAMYSKYINKKCNELVLKAGLKSRVHNENNFYFDQLTDEECQYLINCFREMQTVLARMDVDGSGHIPAAYSRN